jgi:hypothetical protein
VELWNSVLTVSISSISWLQCCHNKVDKSPMHNLAFLNHAEHSESFMTCRCTSIINWKERIMEHSLTLSLAYLFCIGWLSLSLLGWSGIESTITGPVLAYCTSPGWRWVMMSEGNRWNACQWKPKHSEKICPSAALFTTNPTWPHPGSNPRPPQWEAGD